MEEYDGLISEEFRETDVELFTGIMKRAFDEDTRRHLGESAGGPEGYDTGKFPDTKIWRTEPALPGAGNFFFILAKPAPMSLR